MTAVLLLPGHAPEAAWLSARRAGVSASEIAVVMGLAPASWESAYSLWHRKAGNLPEQQDETDEMNLGAYLEGYVAGWFQERFPDFWLAGNGRNLYVHPDRAWQLATPDRLLYETHDEDFYREPVAVLECKTSASYEDWGEEYTDEIPVHYRCQALWQMDVVGVGTCYVACLFLHSRRIRLYELTMDAQAEADLHLMRAAAAEFMGQLEAGIEPAIDWRPETGRALRKLHPLVEDVDVVVKESLRIQYQAAVRNFKKAERRKDEMSNRMLAAIGNGHRAIAAQLFASFKPDVIATRSVSEPKRIDTALLRAEYPDVAAAVTKPPVPEIRLTPAREKT